jgi:AraC-like DNA-binding protein
MKYSVFDPSPALQPFIKCFWTLEDEAFDESSRQRVVPDGCAELIFHYCDPYRQYLDDGTTIIQPRSFVFGQISTFIEVGPSGKTGIVAARFLPQGLTPFIRIPVSSLENIALGLVDVYGIPGKELEEKVLAAQSNAERIQVIEAFLLTLLADPQTVDTVTKACVDTIFQSRGQLDVMQVAGKMNINRRSMERKFISTIGMSPKQLSKVVRLQAALKMMEAGKYTSLTSLAHENGYYDQAHFIKDFREFTGMSPKSFFAANLKLSALFIAAG